MTLKICYSEFFCLALVQKGGIVLFLFGGGIGAIFWFLLCFAYFVVVFCLCWFLKIKKAQRQRQAPVAQLTFKGDCQTENLLVMRMMAEQEEYISLNGDSPYLTGF